MSLLLAVAYDPFMRRTEEACLRGWRSELLAGLGGDVLELGAGTGANLDRYPDAVGRLVLVEPDPDMRRRLQRRLAQRRQPAEICPANATSLPFPAASFDAVVGTLLLCSVVDPLAILREAVRVLRPGGAYVFLEHVACETNHGRLKWQRRIEPLWKRVAGNCHLTRRTGERFAEAGLVVEWQKSESMRKALPFLRPTVRGIARSPQRIAKAAPLRRPDRN
jgi:ubiquinone/menaquinone biosynthesis C-methylase UbiE